MKKEKRSFSERSCMSLKESIISPESINWHQLEPEKLILFNMHMLNVRQS